MHIFKNSLQISICLIFLFVLTVYCCDCGRCKHSTEIGCVRCCSAYVKKRSSELSNPYMWRVSPKFDSFNYLNRYYTDFYDDIGN